MMSKAADKHAGMHFPFTDGIEGLQGAELREGIRGFRLPLPFALDHVNCWLLGEAGDHVLIDTGVDLPSTRELLQHHLAALPNNGGVPTPERLLATHFHPDHIGLAGWFSAAGSALLGSGIETTISRLLWNTEDQSYADFYVDWYTENGLPQSVIQTVKKSPNTYKKVVHSPPDESLWTLLEQGQSVELGGHSYEVIIGRGHAPDMIMLYRAHDRVLIAADQVLPSISPNVSVMPRLDDQNPLHSFLETLERLKILPEDTLVLPSHGAPFVGLHARLNVLREHHELRLSEVLEACDEPRSAHDLFAVLFRRELDAQQMSFALGESLAHLHYLENQGKLTRCNHDGVTRFVIA